MTETKSVYLGNTENITIDETEFEVRGLKLRETLLLGDILAKLITSSFSLVKDTGEVDLAAVQSLVTQSTKDLERIEETLCNVIGKPKGFLLDQDPQFFSGIFTAVLERTKLKVTKENFQKAATAMGMQKKDFAHLMALQPE